ncbi:MAG: response regulator [Gemmatimonadota bacterium]|jgi:two-component system cell cycle sensor histidine kinase/response regulator CckA
MADDTFTRSHPPYTRALVVALVYLAVSAAWILLSDAAVGRLVTDPVSTRWQTYKGLGFVLATSLLIYLLVHREVVRAREGSQRLRALVEQSLAGIYLIRKGRFLYVNPALADVFGYAPAEIMSDLDVSRLVSENDRERVIGNLAAREGGTLEEMQYRFTGRTKDGEDVRVEVHGRRVMWEGQPAVLGILLEVGERERLERQVQEAQRLKALGELTGQIAHDFNNFLTGIIGPLDLSLSDLPEDSRSRPDVEQARATALRAASLSRKLLAFSRKRPALTRPVDLRSVLDEMGPLMDRLVGATVTLEVRPGPSDCTVMIDPTDAEQVVMNLVLNAAEAIDGSGRVTVHTRRLGVGGTADQADGARGAEVVCLEVEDDGRGVPDEILDHIFDPFFTTKEDGTGLGLSTVFGIVSQAGGSIEARGLQGGGTRFAVTLPAAVNRPTTGPSEGAAGAARHGGGKVLLVDDEEVVREVTRRALERHGYAVLTARDGKSAIALAQERSGFDLLLTDVQLPDMVGPDVAEQIASLDPGVRVVFMSGFSNREVIERISATPSVHLLQKPFRVEELVGTLRAVLDDRPPTPEGAGP